MTVQSPNRKHETPASLVEESMTERRFDVPLRLSVVPRILASCNDKNVFVKNVFNDATFAESNPEAALNIIAQRNQTNPLSQTLPQRDLQHLGNFVEKLP